MVRVKEEEIIKIKLEDKLKYSMQKAQKIRDKIKDYRGECSEAESLAYDFQYVQGLLDLYEKEKEKNKILTDEYMIQKHLINADFLKDYISKDKIREKMKEVKYLSTAGYEILQELLKEE